VPRRDGIDPIPGERPYAGWLYVRLREQVIDARQTHQLGITLGATGKPSLAQALQETFHDIAGFRPLLGWDDQLPFEPGIIITYDYRRLLGSAGVRDRTLFVVVPNLGVDLGNVKTNVHGGSSVGLGWNVPHPWARSGKSRPMLAAYGGLSIRGEMVVRDLFLDGSTFAESVSVDRRVFVAEYRVGFALRVGDVMLQYGVTTRSREYETQAHAHTFSSIAVEVIRMW
jgi:hypothetical protein